MTFKRILVTGGNRGIGLSIIQALAERDKNLIILVAARKLPSAEEAILSLKDNLGLEAQYEAVELDVTNDESIRSCLSDVEKKHKGLDGR
jgi:NAD(P)-dependent dehydrogenase (short-subunit alcohol dehydrogenase family)